MSVFRDLIADISPYEKWKEGKHWKTSFNKDFIAQVINHPFQLFTLRTNGIVNVVVTKNRGQHILYSLYRWLKGFCLLYQTFFKGVGR